MVMRSELLADISARRRSDAGILVSRSMPAAAVIIADAQLRIDRGARGRLRGGRGGIAVSSRFRYGSDRLGGRAVPHGLRDAGYPFVSSTLDVLEIVQTLLDGAPQMLSTAVPALRPKLARPRSSTPEPDNADAVADRLVEVVADSADLARGYVMQARVLHDLTLSDAVTGLANRRAFDDRIYLQTHTDAKPGALLMIDVDEFKQINDTRGHQAGDHTLRLIGEAIAESIRPQDFAARIGGDEFAAILPGAGLASARETAERIRRAIAVNADLSVTVSIGLARLAGDSRAVLLAADAALYDAKSGGRDQVSGAPFVSPVNLDV
jgi:diguanylate cyclase (GGDEF)-like protein